MGRKRKTDMIVEDVLSKKSAKPPLEKTQEINEFTTTLSSAVEKYRRFAFGIASRLSYKSMPVWITCANGKIEQMLSQTSAALVIFLTLVIQAMFVLALMAAILLLPPLLAVWYIIFGMV